MTSTPVEKHFDEIAKDYDRYTKKRSLHYSSLKKLLKRLIPPERKVFEVGCGTGDILASLSPVKGYGLDISSKMINIAKFKYRVNKNLEFSTNWPEKRFDYIFMSDVIEHLESPLVIFRKISKCMKKNSLFICTMMNPIWIPVETVYNFFGWKMPEGPHNRISFKEIENILNKAGMKVIKHDYSLLMPINIPFVTKFINKYMEKPFKKFAFIEYFTAGL
jgi:ubiquinone/menaquinone biosynthesis C-methylase UbiE